MNDSRSFNLHHSQGGSAITVHVTARSHRNEIIEVLDDGTVNISLTIGKGDLNQALVAFLSEILGISPNQVEIIAGQAGSDKLVTILNLDARTAQERILSHLA